MIAYDIEEERALSEIVSDRAMVSALKKFFARHETYNTEQARNYLNEDPRDLHHEARNSHLAHRHASMAKAYGTMWAELEKAAKG